MARNRPSAMLYTRGDSHLKGTGLIVGKVINPKGTRISFCGSDSDSFSLIRGTKTAKSYYDIFSGF